MTWFFCVVVSMEVFVTIIDQLAHIEHAAIAALADCGDTQALNEWKSAYLGKQGAIAKLSRELGSLAAADRPAAGQRFNAVRQVLESALDEREQSIHQQEQQQAFAHEAIDVTLPGREPVMGRLHPSTRVLRMISDIFAKAPRSRPTHSTSNCSTFRLIIQPVTCGTPFTLIPLPAPRKYYCARTPHQARSMPCARMHPTRYVSFCQASAIAMSKSRPATK
jgi:hypothetical protein